MAGCLAGCLTPEQWNSVELCGWRFSAVKESEFLVVRC